MIKKIRNGVIFIIITVVIVFVGLEVLLRTATPPDVTSVLPEGIREERSGRILFLEPNFTGVAPATNVEYATNSYGYRDDPIDFDTNHIVFLGDSTTFGLHIPHDDSYPEVIEQTLNANNCAIQSVNTAVPGRGTVNSFHILESVYEQLELSPEVVVYGFFLNDPRDDKNYIDLFEGEPSIFSDTYVFQYLQATVENVETSYEEQRYMNLINIPQEELFDENLTDDWELSLEYIRLIRDLATENGAQFILMYIPVNEFDVLEYSPYALILEEFSIRENITYIDGTQVYRADLGDTDTIPPYYYSREDDMGHPAVYTSSLLADAIYNELEIDGCPS